MKQKVNIRLKRSVVLGMLCMSGLTAGAADARILIGDPRRVITLRVDIAVKRQDLFGTCVHAKLTAFTFVPVEFHLKMPFHSYLHKNRIIMPKTGDGSLSLRSPVT